MTVQENERKKTKLSKKIVFIIPVILVVVTIMAIVLTQKEIIGELTNKMGIYGFNNYIEGVFTQDDGTKILPIVYDNTKDQIQKSEIEKKFKEAGIEIKNISSAKITTGTKIETNKGTYTVLIYGDVDSNNEVDIYDARRVVQDILDKDKNELAGVIRLAANLDNVKENEIDIYDARRIVQFILGRTSIIDSLPESDISKGETSPDLKLNGPEEIKINVFDKYKEQGATSTDKDVKITIVYPDGMNNTIDTSKPGKYTVKYIAENSKGYTTTKTRTIVVLDYTSKIELSGKLAKTEYKEGEKISDLSGIIVTITKKYAGEQKVNLSELSEEYKVTVNPQNATYNEEDDSANKNSIVEIQVNYTNEIDENKNMSSNKLEQTISVIGKIREFIDDNSGGFVPKTTGNIYSVIEVAKIKTKENQENIRYSAKGTDNNISYNVKAIGSANSDTAEVEIEVDKNGIAKIKFYARTAGKYEITIDSEQTLKNGKSKKITVNVTESTLVNAVEIIGSSEVEVREAGEAKDIQVKFLHIYTPKDTNESIVKRQINNVTKNRINVSDSENKLDIQMINEENEVAQNNDVVTGIRIKAKSGSVESTDRLATETTVVKFKVDSNENIGKIQVTIAQESMNEIEIEDKDIKEKGFTMYLQQVEDNNVYEDNGDIYTLIPVAMHNQYGEKQENIDINAENLSTSITDFADENKIVFKDSASSGDESYIKVKGFIKDEETRSTSFKLVESGKIDYIGIALNKFRDEQDEDEKLQNGTIKVCRENLNNVILTIKIKEIVKKDCTQLKATVINKKEYCYENKLVVATIESGAYEKDILPEMLKFSVSPNENGKAKVEASGNNGKVDIKLYAEKKGNYEIKALIDGKEDTAQTFNIEVVDNTNINKIEFTDIKNGSVISQEQNGVVSFGTVRIGKPVTRNIKYYHVYTNDSGVELEKIEVLPEPTNNNIQISDITEGVALILNDNTVHGDETSDTINKIRIEIDNEISADTITGFTMTIKNAGVDGIDAGTAQPFVQRVSIDVGTRIRIKDVRITPVLKNNEKDIVPTLYKNNPQSDIKETVVHIDNYYYTVFKLEIIDDEDEVYPISEALITNNLNEQGEYSNGLTFIDDKNKGILEINPKFGVSSIKLVSLVLNDEEYVQSSDRVDYIGIAATNPDKNPVKAIEVSYKGYILKDGQEQNAEPDVKLFTTIKVKTEGDND